MHFNLHSYCVHVKYWNPNRKPPLLGNKKVIEPDLGQLVVYKPRATPSVYKQLINLGRFNNLNNTMIASVSFVLTGNLICNFPQTGKILIFPCNRENF